MMNIWQLYWSILHQNPTKQDFQCHIKRIKRSIIFSFLPSPDRRPKSEETGVPLQMEWQPFRSTQLQARPLRLWSFASDSPRCLFHSGLALTAISFSLLLPLSTAPCLILHRVETRVFRDVQWGGVGAVETDKQYQINDVWKKCFLYIPGIQHIYTFCIPGMYLVYTYFIPA